MTSDVPEDDMHYTEIVSVTLHRLFNQLITMCGTVNATEVMNDIETLINYVDAEARKEEREKMQN